MEQFVTKKEVETVMTKIDKRFDDIDKKFDAVDARFDELATMIAHGFEDIGKRLDVREEIKDIDKRLQKVESAINI